MEPRPPPLLPTAHPGEGDLPSSGKKGETRASILAVEPSKAQVLTMAPGVGLRPFSFTRVFDASSSQREVYEGCARRAVADLVNGESGCVLVYGQTGAGKTHTMFGQDAVDRRLPRHEIGIVPVRRAVGICLTLGGKGVVRRGGCWWA